LVDVDTIFPENVFTPVPCAITTPFVVFTSPEITIDLFVIKLPLV
jgi:hypothetical protein